MTKIRIIRYSNESGTREGVFFTEDMDLLTEDVVPGGCDYIVETVIDAYGWDCAFPMEYNLERR